MSTSKVPSFLSLLFLGPPGVGKGTYGKRIAKKLNLPLVTAGDLIRDEITKKSDFGVKFKAVAERGELIDPTEVVNLVRGRLQGPDCQKGYLLDGFPRSVDQAKTFHGFFPPLSLVVDIQLENKYLIPKVLGRRVCLSCGNNYNVADIEDTENGVRMPPLLPRHGRPDTCDCGCQLTMRADDNLAVVNRRLEVFEEETAPLRDYYRTQSKVFSFRIKRGLDDLDPLYEGLLRALK